MPAIPEKVKDDFQTALTAYEEVIARSRKGQLRGSDELVQARAHYRAARIAWETYAEAEAAELDK